MAAPPPPTWHSLPPLPDLEGFAAPFAGVHEGALIVAGGANFPEKRPWEGGTKAWYDTVYVLKTPEGKWQAAGKLPTPLGYGVSLSTPAGVVCAGGSDAERHHREVFLLTLKDGIASTTSLPPLPKPCANACGALAGSILYIAGGLEKADDSVAMKTFWSLDLANPKAGWQGLEPWPGPERMLATTAWAEGSFYLFSGASLTTGADGKPERKWLKDAYRYTPGKGWQTLKELPKVAVAAPSPAPPWGGTKLLVLGGDDGAQVKVMPTQHKGFPRSIQAYDIATDSWEMLGEVPFSLVTTSAVEWNGSIVVPGGEARPGIRSTEVWAGK
ncbi:MAG: galactose oxidase [Chthoniobacteraceae bacterium]